MSESTSWFVSTEVMLKSGEKATVYYLTEEGKKQLATLPNNIKWIHSRIDTAFEQINKIRDELVEAFFLEKMQFLIVNELRNEDKTQQQISQMLPDFTTNPMVHYAFYRAWTRFEKAKVIVPISQGRGHSRLWNLTVKDHIAKTSEIKKAMGVE